MARKPRILVTARSSNEKTGDVPTVWVGADVAESKASCKGCHQLETGACYAQYGTTALGLGSMARTARLDGSFARYSMDHALAGRSKKATFVRFSAIGDVARANRNEVKGLFRATAKAGLDVVGYTHFWATDGAWLRGRLMASCDTWDMAREANAAGWRAAIVAPAGTVGTIRNADGSIFAVECPAIAAARHGRTFTCLDCNAGKRGALCAASKEGPNVYFADHGPVARRAAKKLPIIANSHA
jgi:hypothetical protein